ncbi:polyhydroxyalkanoate synthesis repressor PhaR [Govanella unica]|uniref:Polyhydroxyalkanoate synthesis repressor PhaR n=1 Tax=Govanella unica TaxID=2975056 RepID=A0A9X3Z620_9PROT|nr:polyhydroxyalkanoate synthesis repressor PhaR [Govania unica]
MVDQSTDKEPVVIKKYANRRLYNTESSSYVTLEHLCQMVKDGRDFVVRDAKTGEDITHSVLTQIIFEEESKSGQTLLPINFLRQLISFYGNGLQSVLPGYLEATMEMFSRNQDQYRDYFQQHFAPAKAFASSFEEIARQNMAVFERASRMFTPFVQPDAMAGTEPEPQAKAEPKQPAEDFAGTALKSLRDQLDAMQAQIDSLSKKG